MQRILSFIDESGSDTTITSEYDRIEGGKRLKTPKPAGTWEQFTIIGAISILRVVAMMYGKWATDTFAFLTFIKDFLLKSLKRSSCYYGQC
jgi:hypothetical protein